MFYHTLKITSTCFGRSCDLRLGDLQAYWWNIATAHTAWVRCYSVIVKLSLWSYSIGLYGCKTGKIYVCYVVPIFL